MKKRILYGIGVSVLSFFTIFLLMNVYMKSAIPIEHEVWIKEKGLPMASYFPKKKTFEVPQYPEAIESFQLANVHFNGYKKRRLHSTDID
ncbi:hypothetical protein KUV80_07820 [Fictibacillus nanhaiensis]|uniref:hypothetical protein n=1 Tax=Fictibacillus nanhaiensis TaxID=742169 RepID=UPI001C9727B8|nr:hypothetical protein [Fictibacillus nanhaiensis]MBY6036555.1 hypothetical protein [Fictibacillus nanhaiensis]